ncbi:FAD-dependent oxidoreductase [Hamadaea sp. NPDC051192]|uniref:FAD-dependent oxidoreductase n=1 Tax=Hamadaea sp. NPDC051192 TaxID=3154940 RepID=UPI00344A2C82
MSTKRIAVVGAGVIGLTSAIVLAEDGFDVTVYAEQIPGATSLAAGASWGPYLVQPYDRVQTWAAHTLAVLTEHADQPQYGVSMLSGIEASRNAAVLPAWAAALPGVRSCEPGELPAGFTCGWRYTIPVVDMPVYLNALIARLLAAGGSFVQRHLDHLDELAGQFAAVVNASGLGATVLADDATLYPVRGQLVVVTNPGITEFFSEDTGDSADLTHFLPHRDHVVLGGTASAMNADSQIDLDVSAAIMRRCAAIEPRLASATVIEHRVGLRPTRPEIRVEIDRSHRGLVVHNYGHGGAGLSLSWGCAQTVRSMVFEG